MLYVHLASFFLVLGLYSTFFNFLIKTSLPTELSLIYYPQVHFSCNVYFFQYSGTCLLSFLWQRLIISHLFLLVSRLYFCQFAFWIMCKGHTQYAHVFSSSFMFSPICIIISCECSGQVNNNQKIRLLFPGQITLCRFLIRQIRSCHSLIIEVKSTDTPCPCAVGTINSSIKENNTPSARVPHIRTNHNPVPTNPFLAPILIF